MTNGEMFSEKDALIPAAWSTLFFTVAWVLALGLASLFPVENPRFSLKELAGIMACMSMACFLMGFLAIVIYAAIPMAPKSQETDEEATIMANFEEAMRHAAGQ